MVLTTYHGVNLRSDAERTGGGAKSPKASGILMVDGVLYLWVRNVANAQLLWSLDRGKTWQWGFKFEEGFGSPSFLNFGRNYDGARDEYVYTYSQDGPSAYESDNGLALARVRKDRIRERAAWEFYREPMRTVTSGMVRRISPAGVQVFSVIRRTAIGLTLCMTLESGGISWHWHTTAPEAGGSSMLRSRGVRGQPCSTASGTRRILTGIACPPNGFPRTGCR